MTFGDLIRTCLNNLFRHKGRTILTIIGVIVGCSSVVLMLSIGIAKKQQMMQFMDSMGDLSVITVRPKGNKKLDNAIIKQIKSIPKVQAVSPELSTFNDVEINVQTADGRYITSYSSFVATDTSTMDDFGYQVKSGKLLTGSEPNGILIGEYAAYNFTDSLRPEGYNTIDYWAYKYDESKGKMPDPYFNPETTDLQLVISTGENNGKKMTFDLKLAGVLKEDEGKGWETTDGFYMDTKALLEFINEFKRANSLSINPVVYYDTIKVKPVNISDVKEVSDTINNLGFETHSMQTMRESVEKEANQTQMMFGVLGVVSLFVAAIGIMNTMIMAISERTREIGVMKALGCFENDIRAIYLCEAGFIGLIGGVFGSIISLIISAIANIIALKLDFKQLTFLDVWDNLTTNPDRVSAIPWQLAVGAVFFSIFVGILSGYYPANRAATKISALDAIKTE